MSLQLVGCLDGIINVCNIMFDNVFRFGLFDIGLDWIDDVPCFNI